ncbi:MAG: GbsR/MarR family transcriptional regulator [Polyangiales bacterium]
MPPSPRARPLRAKTRPKSTAKEPKEAPLSLSEVELTVSDAVGRLMEFWGFKRNMGRVWAVMYLSPEPLTAADLKELLQISSGAVSMTVAELMRWGVVKKVWVQGERRDFYVAETALWRMISRVLGERERAEIAVAVESLERALEVAKHLESKADADMRARLDLQVRRVKPLLDFAKLGRTLLDALLSTAKVDAEPLTRFLLGSRHEG